MKNKMLMQAQKGIKWVLNVWWMGAKETEGCVEHKGDERRVGVSSQRWLKSLHNAACLCVAEGRQFGLGWLTRLTGSLFIEISDARPDLPTHFLLLF